MVILKEKLALNERTRKAYGAVIGVADQKTERLIDLLADCEMETIDDMLKVMTVLIEAGPSRVTILHSLPKVYQNLLLDFAFAGFAMALAGAVGKTYPRTGDDDE